MPDPIIIMTQDLLLALDLTRDFLDDLIGHIFGEWLPMPRLLIFYPYRYNIGGEKSVMHLSPVGHMSGWREAGGREKGSESEFCIW